MVARDGRIAGAKRQVGPINCFVSCFLGAAAQAPKPAAREAGSEKRAKCRRVNAESLEQLLGKPALEAERPKPFATPAIAAAKAREPKSRVEQSVDILDRRISLTHPREISRDGIRKHQSRWARCCHASLNKGGVPGPTIERPGDRETYR